MVQDEGQDDSDDDEDDEPGRPLASVKELAGMKVRHTAEELAEGQTMILTLADRGILNDAGNLVEDNDELENALVVCITCSLHCLYSSNLQLGQRALQQLESIRQPGE